MELCASEIAVRFAGVVAIENVSLKLEKGEILGLVGPNGAGKTTMLNVLSGFEEPHAGEVAINGAAARGRSETWFARNGVVRTFQAVRLFKGLTVSENVEAALSSCGFGRFAARRRANEILDYLGVGDRAHKRADALNYRDERRVGIARARPQSAFPSARRAGGGNERGGSDGAPRPHQTDPAGFRLWRAAHKTQHETGRERLHVLASGKTLAAGRPDEVLANEGRRSPRPEQSGSSASSHRFRTGRRRDGYAACP